MSHKAHGNELVAFLPIQPVEPIPFKLTQRHPYIGGERL